DVDPLRPHYEEEPRGEVVELVGRECVEGLAVDGELPAREESGVLAEEPLGFGRARVDVAPVVAHQEDVPFEDAPRLARHGSAPLERSPRSWPAASRGTPERAACHP